MSETQNTPAPRRFDGAARSAQRRIAGSVKWTPLHDWHPAFRRAWWIGGQFGQWAPNAHTVGVRICGLFIGVWWYWPNAVVSDGGTPFAPRPGSASVQHKET